MGGLKRDWEFANELSKCLHVNCRVWIAGLLGLVGRVVSDFTKTLIEGVWSGMQCENPFREQSLSCRAFATPKLEELEGWHSRMTSPQSVHDAPA